MSLYNRKLHAPPAILTGIDGHLENAMVDPPGTAPGSRPAWPGSAATPTCLIITMLVIAYGVMGWCWPAQGADPPPAPQTSTPGGSLTFEEAVKIAITQSPYFVKSSLDIDIQRMDESDSRYSMVPPLTFRTYYYVNRPSQVGTGPPYSINFSMDPYNPIGAYFTLQAQKLVSQVAVLSHLKVISKGLVRLGAFYLELDTLHQQAANQKELVQVARDNVTYVENRQSLGTATSLEVKVARQQLDLALGEQESIALSQKRALTGLKGFLGMQSVTDFTVNYQDSRRQVLGKFDPATATLEQAKNRSYELKAMELQKQLQTYHIRLAIAKVFPSILFNTQTPDPLSVTTARGLYVGLGLEIPVWDGLKRIRNVSRQKAMLRQIGAQKAEKEGFIENLWFEDVEDIQGKGLALKNSQAMEDLAKLKARQNEIRYQSGEDLAVLLDSRREVLNVKKDTLAKGLEYDKAVLQLRELSGDLGYTYVDEKAWQK